MCRHFLVLIFAVLMPVLLNLQAHAQASGQVVEKRESFLSGGRRIGVKTFTPAGAGRHPAVIILHSAAGTLVGSGELESLARALASRGKAAFVVRYFDRTGTIFAGNEAIDRYTAVWIGTTRDSVNFVANHPRVRSESIGLFGYSLGAYLSVAVGSTDPRIDVVAEVAGGIFSGFRPQMRRFPPMLILHGAADQRVPVSNARELASVGRRFRAVPAVHVYPGEGHRLSPVASADATRRTIAFFDRYLLPGPGRR